MENFEPLKDLIANSVRDGNLKLAVEFLTQLLTLEDTIPSRLQRADLLLKTGSPDLAIGDLNHVLAQHPANEAALVLRARAFAAKGLFERAEADSGRALQLNALNADAWIVFGHAAWKLHDNESAMRAFMKHSELPPELRGDLVEVQRYLEDCEVALPADGKTPGDVPTMEGESMASFWRPGPATEELNDDENFVPNEVLPSGFPLRLEMDPRQLVGLKVKLVLEVEFEQV
ncbi:MAG: hypothetical protein AAB074_17990 [Planctomycetota bacterium]